MLIGIIALITYACMGVLLCLISKLTLPFRLIAPCKCQGNKADCNPTDRMVKKEDGERLANEYSVTFMETSAKSGFNVDIAFMAVARYFICIRYSKIIITSKIR